MPTRKPTPDILGAVLAATPSDPPITRQEIDSLQFDYTALDPADVLATQHAAVAIKRRQQRAAADILQIGAELQAVKERLDHGLFGDWLQAEFAMTQRTAQNYMLLHSEYDGDPEPLAMLGQTVALLAAAPSTPPEAKAAIVEAAEAAQQTGDKLTKRQAAAIVADHKPATEKPGPKLLYLPKEETIALIWRALKDWSRDLTDEERLKQLRSYPTTARWTVYLPKGTRFNPNVFVSAFASVEGEIENRIRREKRFASPTTPPPQGGTIEAPPDLAALGWELRQMESSGKWWLHNRRESRATAPHVDAADAIAEAYTMQQDLRRGDADPVDQPKATQSHARLFQRLNGALYAVEGVAADYQALTGDAMTAPTTADAIRHMIAALETVAP